MKLENHPRIIAAIKDFGIKHGLWYYSYFYGFVDLYKAGVPPLPFPTFGVTLIKLRLSMLWNEEFLSRLNDNNLKWLLLHELYHLLLNHINRAKSYKQNLANIAQDMIINKLIEDNYAKIGFVPDCLSKEDWDKMSPERQAIHKPGDPNCVTLDPAYTGVLAFEPLYAWLENENAKPNQGGLSEKTKDMLKQNDGQSTDAHIMSADEVTDEMRRQIVEQVSEKCKQLSRGMNTGNVDGVLDLLLKPPANNNLRYIRRVISQVKGSVKSPSYARPNRRAADTKGNKKVGMGLTVIWDWSGSMYGEHEKVASELYRDGYELDVIGADTEIKNVYKVRSKKELAKVPFKGGGGTELMPAIDYVKDPKNRLTHKPLIILTDGYTDALDLSGFHQQVLILTVGQECSIIAGQVKQIKIEA